MILEKYPRFLFLMEQVVVVWIYLVIMLSVDLTKKGLVENDFEMCLCK
jgi:hypothetical protein